MMKDWVFPVIAMILVAMLSGTGVCQEESSSSSQGPVIKFSKYTAELYTSETQGHGSHSRRVVFDDKHAYEESAYLNDASYSYSYFNGGDHKGRCDHVGDHNNCFVLLGSLITSEYVLREDVEGITFVDCPVVEDPILGGSKRKLEKCYYYGYPSSDKEGNKYWDDWWIESGTHYPVRYLRKIVEPGPDAPVTYRMID